MNSDPEQQLEPPSPESHEVIGMEEAMPETPAQSKERLGGAIQKAKETITGSGSLVKEIGNTGKAYLDIPKKMLVTPLEAMWELVRLHPIEAAKKTAQGAGEIGKDIASITTAPFRLAAAGMATTKKAAVAGVTPMAKAAGKTVKAPFKAAAWVAKSPLRVFDVLNKGINKLAA